jgi:hypothetical protein
VKRAAGLCAAAVALLSAVPFLAGGGTRDLLNQDLFLLDNVNRRLNGHVDDYTNNHGGDRRIFSQALQKPMPLYVYVPPHYDPQMRYPVMIVLHGILQDEKGFLKYAAEPLDEAISCGRLPPLIIVSPNGVIEGRHTHHKPGSFFINGPAGNYQDWILNDVWDFVTANYPIRPEPTAHVLTGISMGGFGAFNIAIKYRNRFQIVLGMLPALNIRWVDKSGNYRGKFSPDNWGWRETPADPNEIIGSLAGGLISFRVKDFIFPAFGTGWDGLNRASAENPIELVDRLNLKNGELDMFVGYAGCDEFNLDAQAESFLYLCELRGIKVSVYYDPTGTHSAQTAGKMGPYLIDWLGERLRSHGIDRAVPK